MSTEQKKIMVIGGGIAGLTAAWELSRFNLDVQLIEKTAFLGGYAIQYCCKATDECQQCGACSVEAMLKNVVNEPKIKVQLATEVETINNKERFSVKLKQSAYTPDPVTAGIVSGYSKNNSPLHVIVNREGGQENQDAIPEGAVDFDQLGFSGDLEVKIQ